ncbi:TPA: beta-hexosaminidase, partial [Streptococcus suis]|nr:beta-hexosaminidase [Streptococcus suis]
LRNELGFEGVIMTDDFDMQGLVQFVDQDTGALQTIQAGTDMILSSSYASQIPYIVEQVKNGTITEERINQSVKRILGMKYDLGLIK